MKKIKKRMISLLLALSMLASMVPVSPSALAATPPDASLVYRPFSLSGIPLAQYTAQEYPSDDHGAQLPLVDMLVQGGTPIIVAPATQGGVPVLYKLNPTTMAVESHYDLPIPADYDFYGKTILGADGCLYTTVGYDNQTEDPNKVVMKVYRINTLTFGVLGTAEIKATDGVPMTDNQRIERSIRKPLMGGLSAMSLSDDGSKLYILMGKEIFQGSDGLVHQTNIAFTVDTETMAASYGIDGKISYVSHSLNQKLLVDGNKVVTLDHGDVHPRALRLSVFEAGKEVISKDIFDMPSTKPNKVNFTGFTVTGFEATPTSYLITGTSRSDWDKVPWEHLREKNVYLLTVDKATLATTVQWIVPEESIRVSTPLEPRLVKLADDSMILIYTRIKNSLSLTRYQRINANGSLNGVPLTDIGMTVETAVQPILVGNSLLFLGKNGSRAGAISKLDIANPEKPVPVSNKTAMAAEEQFDLATGETYYFNLSQLVNPKTFANKNAALPDPTLHFVPFTYAGTVNAYSLTNQAAGDMNAAANATPSDRSLFVSDHNLSIGEAWTHWFGTSWVEDPGKWKPENLIYGTNMGEHFRLRSLTGGSQMALGSEGAPIGRFGLPMSNEWDTILSKNPNYIKNTDLTLGEDDNKKEVASWMQDNDCASQFWFAMRGGRDSVTWQQACNSSGADSWGRTLSGFRPAIEVKNPTALGKDGMQCVTLHLNGATLGGKTALKMVRVVGETFVAPGTYSMVALTGTIFKGWSVAANGSGTVYKEDAAIPAGVTELYAIWETTEEQFSLEPGGTYYFDLSATVKNLSRFGNINFNPAVAYGRTEKGKPSPGLVPFTYVGTVKSYDGETLSHMPTPATETTPRSLFVAQHTVVFNCAVKNLDWNDCFYGKEENGFILRAMTGGIESWTGEIKPDSNEYDRILRKAAAAPGNPNWFPNQATVDNDDNIKYYNLMQDHFYDKSYDMTLHTLRGVPKTEFLFQPPDYSVYYGWRPAVQVVNSPAIGRDDLKAITIDLNGGTFDGKTTFKIASAGASYVAPLDQYVKPDTGAGRLFYWSTVKTGNGESYAPGVLVPSSVTTLYARWDGTNPTMDAAAFPTIYWKEECNMPLQGGAFQPYTWELTSGTLPNGVTLVNGVLTGTPTLAGKYPITLMATNSIGYSSSFQKEINVVAKDETDYALTQAKSRLEAANALAPLEVGTYDTQAQILQGIQKNITAVLATAPAVEGVSVSLHKIAQTVPVPGTADDLAGTAGTYRFTVTITNGAQSVESQEIIQRLAAPAYALTSNKDAVDAAIKRINNGIHLKGFPAFSIDNDAARLEGIKQYAKLSMAFASEDTSGVIASVVKGTRDDIYVVTLTKGAATKTTTIKMLLTSSYDTDLVAAAQMGYILNCEGDIQIDQLENNVNGAYLAAIKTRVETVMNAEFPQMTVAITESTSSPFRAPKEGTFEDPDGSWGWMTIDATFTQKKAPNIKASKRILIAPTPYGKFDIKDGIAVDIAKRVVVDGTAEVLTGADQAAKTAAVQVYVNGLMAKKNDVKGVKAAVFHKEGDRYLVSFQKGGFVDSKIITMTLTEVAETNEAAVERAKTLVVTGAVNVDYGAEQAAKTAAVQTYVNTLMGNTGVAATVTFVSENNYTVALSKGTAADSKTITMTVNVAPDPDIAIVAGVKDRVVGGTVSVAYGADHVVKTAAVQTYVNTLMGNTGVVAAVTLDSGSDYTVALSKGKVTDSKIITMTVNEAPDPDIAIVENAKKLVVTGTVNVDYGAEQAAKTAAVQMYVDTLMGNTGVTATVTYGSGSTYNVQLSKGAARVSKTITMTVNEAPDPDIAVVAGVKNRVVGGTVSVPYGANQAVKTAAVQTYVDTLIGNTGVAATVTFVSDNNYAVALSRGAATDSKTIAMTVNVAAAVDAQAPSLTANLSTEMVAYNKGATIVTPLDATATVTDGGTVTYDWYSNNEANIESPTKLNSTGATYTPAVTEVGETYYYCVATNTNLNATGEKTAATTSAFAHIKVVNPLASIDITKQPDKVAYTFGERFDIAGMVVTATYADTSTAPATGYTVLPAGALTMADNLITVSYTDGVVTKTTTQAITVSQKTVADVTNTAGVRYNAAGVKTHPLTGLPADLGEVTYVVGAIGTNTILSGTPTCTSGMLSFTTVSGTVGQTAVIPVTVKSTNYNDFVIRVTVKLIDKENVDNNITFANGELSYTGGALIYETATIKDHVPGDNPTWTYTYVAEAGTGTLDGAGKPLTVGTYIVTATYEDSNNMGRKSATLTVQKADSTVDPKPDSKIYTYGEPITLTATVGVKTSRAIQNEVEFFAGATLLGTAPVQNGKAELVYDTTRKDLAIGSNSIHAVYGGSVNLNGSNSGIITVTLQAKDLTGELSAVATKVYDGNENFANIDVTLTGAESGDKVGATAALTTVDSNVGADKAISTASVTLNGENKDYYNAPATLSGRVAITAKHLTVSEGDLAITKVYDGTTAAAAATGKLALNGAIAGDAVTLDLGIIPVYDRVGIGNTYSLSLPVSLSGAACGNYTLDPTYSFTAATITPATVTAPIIAPQTIKQGKNLDDLKVQIGSVKAGGANGEELEGILELTAPGFESLELGSYDISFTFTKDSADAKWENYDNASVSGTVTVEITALDPQVIAFAESGTQRVTYGDPSFINLCTNETENGGGITYVSSAAAVATVAATTGEVTIVGAGSAIITATAAEVTGQFAQTTAQYGLTVDKKTITITDLAVQPKNYDTNTKATLTGGALSGVLEGDADDVSFTLPAAAAFDTVSAGSQKAVTIGAITLTGTRSGNYDLTQPTDLTGEIRKATPLLKLGHLSQQQNSSGKGVTAVTAVLTPASADAVALVEYYVCKTAAVPGKPAVPGVACNHTAGTKPCTAAAGGVCTHNDGCTYKAGMPAETEKPAVYDWTVTVPQLAGEYDVRATLPVDKAGINLEAVTTPVTGKLTIKAYTAPSGGGGGSVTPPSPKPSAPVTDPDTGNTNVSLPVEPVDKSGVSTATVPEKSIIEAIAAAKKEAEKTGGTSSVEIQIAAAKDAKAVDTVFSGNSLAAMAKDTDGLKISGGIAELAFDKAALGAIAGGPDKSVRISAAQVDINTLTAAQQAQVENAAIFNFTVTSGKDIIADFGGGKVTVTLPYTLKKGETADNVGAWYLDATGQLIKLSSKYDAKTQMLTFVIDHFSHYVVGYDKTAAWVNPFTDVAASAWYFEAVRYANQNGLFAGISKDTFDPAAPMTRSMLWTVLYRMAGQPGKTDTADIWYADAQAWVISQNISDGKNPDGDVTRAQLATILYRYAKATAVQTDMSSFTDAAAIADFAKEGMSWAVGNKILQGNQGKLNPQGNAARAEVATMLQRFATLQV